MNASTSPIGEDDLQAFVDGRLPAERAAAVGAYLAAHPEVARRVAAEQGQRDALRAELRRKFDEPVPARLRVAAIAAERRRRVLRRLSRVAAAVAYLAIGAAGGWSLHERLAAGSWSLYDRLAGGGAATGALVNEALRAHRTFVVEVRHPVEVEAAQEAHLVQWLSRRLGHDLKLPDLSRDGFRLVGGRLLPAQEGPAAQFMYENGSGRRLTLYVTADGGDRPTAFRFREQGGVSAFYWVDGGFGYAVLAEADRTNLLAVAETVYEQMGVPPAGSPPPPR
jgi:anti-sigma factor RsiW